MCIGVVVWVDREGAAFRLNRLIILLQSKIGATSLLIPIPGVGVVRAELNSLVKRDPTAIPAFMRWGDWNSCPQAAYHVAALRAWRDRYGAELIGLSSDTINLRVARKPATREEALELARAQYVYCNDIIDQGVGSYLGLAAGLMTDDWWYFWWD